MKHQIKLNVDVDVELYSDFAKVELSIPCFSRKYKIDSPIFSKFGDYIFDDDREKIAVKKALRLFQAEINEDENHE